MSGGDGGEGSERKGGYWCEGEIGRHGDMEGMGQKAERAEEKERRCHDGLAPVTELIDRCVVTEVWFGCRERGRAKALDIKASVLIQ